MNKAVAAKDMHSFEMFMSYKLSIDVHIVGKNTLSNFRSLFSFSGSLFMLMNASDATKFLTNNYFDSIDVFQDQVIMLPIANT